MKKLIWGVIIFASISLLSCKKSNDVKKLVEQQMTTDEMFERISKEEVNLDKGNALLVDYEFDNRTGLVRIKKFSQGKPESSIFSDFNFDVKNTDKADSYTVKCSFSSSTKKDWTKTCSGKFECGTMVYDCLKAGGCSTICNSKLVYTPETYTFYVNGEMISQSTSL